MRAARPAHSMQPILTSTGVNPEFDTLRRQLLLLIVNRETRHRARLSAVVAELPPLCEREPCREGARRVE